MRVHGNNYAKPVPKSDANVVGVFGQFIGKDNTHNISEGSTLSVRDKGYSDLMRELWGSPDIWNTKRSYLEIATKLGVDEETVRNRIKHLRENGFLLGYRVVPNPVLLGGSTSSILIEFRDRESKQNVIPRLAKMEGVVNIASTYDKSVLVTLFGGYGSDFSNLLVGMGIDAEVSSIPGLGLRPTSFRMTNLDWEIVALLLRNAERKLDEVARELRVSTRTVKRRLNIMMRDAAIFTMPIVDLRKTEGISYQLRVQTEPGKKLEVEKAIIARIGNVVFRATDSQNGSIFGFTGANVAEGNDILEWIKQQSGVKQAGMTIAERVFHSFDWIESEVNRRMKQKEVGEVSPGKMLRKKREL